MTCKRAFGGPPAPFHYRDPSCAYLMGPLSVSLSLTTTTIVLRPSSSDSVHSSSVPAGSLERSRNAHLGSRDRRSRGVDRRAREVAKAWRRSKSSSGSSRAQHQHLHLVRSRKCEGPRMPLEFCSTSTSASSRSDRRPITSQEASPLHVAVLGGRPKSNQKSTIAPQIRCAWVSRDCGADAGCGMYIGLGRWPWGLAAYRDVRIRRPFCVSWACAFCLVLCATLATDRRRLRGLCAR
ncbi:hypothetical protein OH76DRAFT_897858 [Lentinus brumalis]|uniref:Uncharacterized protein n=1 Tax=Lentinus brumalis TaxID=2498619 RepID=A0A371D0N4_9APHY|nr:hypothetical protein OH76DRAFT_897858 [Polyporus brumalis]